MNEPEEPYRILLVDDDEVDRAAVRRLLREALPGRVDECQRADQVEACVSERSYDCVLLDFHLPDGDGLQVLRRLRATAPEVAVVILTGYGDEQLAVELMKSGASDYVAKNSLSGDRLAASIRQSVRAARAEREMRRLEEERRILLLRERSAREQAEAANVAKDQFLAMLSHELRTPLNAILGWARILRTQPLQAGDVAKGLQTIERNARAQAQLIEDLLDVSRIMSGKLRLEMRAAEPAGVVAAALDSVRVQADTKGVRLREEVDHPPATILADPDRLQQVVWNLLSNAIKFTPRGGAVSVRVAGVAEGVEITVADDGDGIPPDFLPRIFDRFAQAATDRRHGGLGLGLAIVKHIVEQHGGTVEAASDGPGRGSTFRVRLPAAVAVAPAAEQRTPLTGPPPGRQRLAGLKVLVVDDHDDTRVVVSHFLTRQGADVATCGSVQEALASFASRPPDVLVSDIEMPGRDGYALIRDVRALGPAAHGVPAVALTGAARVEDRIRTLAAGYQMHVPKPVDPDELVAAVAALANREGSDTGAEFPGRGAA